MTNNKPILLTSLPRSGSTWVLKVLSSAPGIVSFFEPDHLDMAGLGTNGMHPYIRGNDPDEGYFNLYNRIFKGRPYRPFTFSQGYFLHYLNAFQSFLPNRTVLVKSVYSLPNIEWISNNFSPTVVILLRNPFSVVHSIHRKFPSARLKDLLPQEKLMQDYLEPYKKTLQSADSIYEILASKIGAYYKIIEESSKNHPEWIILTHEELCEETFDGYKRLFDKLGLCWQNNTYDLIKILNKPKQSDDIKHVNRDLREEINKWQTQLSPEEIKVIWRYYSAFNCSYYSDTLSKHNFESKN